MAIAPLPHFQATWDKMPESLRPPVQTLANKVARIAWNVISVLIPIIGLYRLAAYALGRLALFMILPAATLSEEVKSECRDLFAQKCLQRSQHFEIIHKTVVSPNGAQLAATCFRHRNATAETPTTLYFGGNGTIKGMGCWDWILQNSIDKNTPMNLVICDYRSAGDSKGKLLDTKDFAIDAHSLVQWVRESLKTPDNRIHFHGFSLGGAIAVKIKAADEKLSGNLVTQQSFSSVEEMLQVPRPLAWLLARILKSGGFDLDVVADLDRLKGKKLAVFHRRDPIIPYTASVARKFPEKETFELREKYSHLNHHCSPLNLYHGAQEKVSNFLFA